MIKVLSPFFLILKLSLFSLLLFIRCSSPQEEALNALSKSKLFTEIPKEISNLDFNNSIVNNPETNENILSYEYFYNGGGVAIGDINNDGLQDIFLTGNQVPNKLYLNKGNLAFEDITEKAGLQANFWCTGATMADLNQDGFLDIYVCNSGPKKNPETRPNQFYLNNGDGTFKECAKDYGIQDKNRSTQSAFIDYDMDGDLDLFVINHADFFRLTIFEIYDLLQDKNELKKVTNNLYRNNGNGSFTKVTEEANLLRYGFGLGLVVSDINTDGLPDIYVANDFDVPDFMYINMGDGTFKDNIKSTTKHITWSSMGCDIADINNDGSLDIGVVDMSPNDHVRSKTLMKTMNTEFNKLLVNKLKRQHQYMFNTLQVNNGDNVFSEIGMLSGIGKTDWSWTALFTDLDNDGYKDYFITNGFRKYATDNDFQHYVKDIKSSGKQLTKTDIQNIYDQMPEVKLPNVLFKNNKDLTFTDIAPSSGLEKATISNGAASVDLDNDGDLDLVINNTDQDLLLYRNNSEQKENNFLQINLEGKRIHSKVIIHYGDNELQIQELSPTRGFQSSMPHTLHFGLGTHKSVSKVEITWPDGQVQDLENIKANQILSIKREQTHTSKPKKFDLLFSMENPYKLGINYRHQENNHDDFKKEVLLPHAQSKLGPFAAVADLNNDGLDDLFLGGAKGQTGKLYQQLENGTFKNINCPDLELDSESEDMDALFFDANNDGLVDLYVVSGGGSDFDQKSPLLQDRLYLNNGKGNFSKSKNALPKMLSSGAKVKACDIDLDGDLDLFIGGRTLPGQYPFSPKSYLLKNEGGTFKDITFQQAPDLSECGMVTDFVFSDFNGDHHPDLILVGEWMPVSFFSNDGKGHFTSQNTQYPSQDLQGWWYSIVADDLDDDGDDDYILGNIGLNNKFHPSHKKPLHVYANDFDENGNFDIVISSYYKGRQVPMRGKECSTQQIPGLAEKFPSYKSFANASLEEVYGIEHLESSLHLQANTFSSVVLLSHKDSIQIIDLPLEAQVSSINKIIVRDMDNNGTKDLITIGNMYHTEFETTRYDASNGNLLSGDGTGNFSPVPFSTSGLFAPFDSKDMEWITIGPNKKEHFIITNNNRSIQLYGIN